MNNKKNGIPKLRFPGFTGAWEQRKLGEITSVITKGTTPLDKSGKGSINFVKVEDLSPDNSGINVHSMISKEEHEGRLKRSILKENDILFSIAGTLGRIGIVKSEILPANTNQALAIVRLKEGNLSYISTVLEGRTVREYIRQNPTVGAQPNLSLKQVSELRISFPTLQEQEQVGNFFNKLNSFIALHQRKLEHLQEQKKGLLQKMFPKNGETVPEVRFPGFTDAWEQRKWVDSINISNEMVDPTTGKFDDMPHIAPGNIESFTGRILDNVKTVKEEELISGKFLFKPGDVVFGKINPQLGKYFYARVEGLTSADSYVLNGKNKNITQMFIFLLLQTRDFFKYSVSVSKRSGIPKINREELNGFKFLIPCKEEQEKIGDFFLNIDSLIALHQRKLDHLELMKKGLLQQMFV